MNDTAKAATILGLALIAAALLHGGFYTMVPAAGRPERPGIVFVMNKFTGEVVKFCAPLGCSPPTEHLPAWASPPKT